LLQATITTAILKKGKILFIDYILMIPISRLSCNIRLWEYEEVLCHYVNRK
jgi:hypothetical protein